MWRTPERRRALRLLLGLGLVLICGLGYAWFAFRFHGIPCVFRRITGLKCPGCGVTGMCLHLLKGEWGSAFRQNMALFCLLPAFGLLGVHRAYQYVKTGGHSLARWENVMVWVMVWILLAFGVLRNLMGL